MNLHAYSLITSQLAWTYRNMRQRRAYVTQTINQTNKTHAIDSTVREEKGQ